MGIRRATSWVAAELVSRGQKSCKCRILGQGIGSLSRRQLLKPVGLGRHLRNICRYSVTGLPLPNRISLEGDIVVELVRNARRSPTPAAARIRRPALGRARAR